MVHILRIEHKGFLGRLGRKGVKIRISKYEIRNEFEYQNFKSCKLQMPDFKEEVFVI